MEKVQAAGRSAGSVTDRRWFLLGVLFLVSCVSYADRQILTILLEPIKHEFGMSDMTVGLLGGAPFAICYSLAGIPFALWADRGNRKVLLIAALVLWTLMTGLCGLAPTLAVLLAARMGVGVGEAGALSPSHSLIADYFPPGERARAFALFGSSATVGVFLALAGGGWIAGAAGWRSAFLAMSLLSVPVALLAAVRLREPRGKATSRQSATAEPLAHSLRRLAAKSSYVRLVIGFTAYALFSYGPMSFVPAYMVRVFGQSLAAAGMSYGLAATLGTLIGMVLGGPVADRLSHRDARWLLRLPALCLMVAGPLAFAAFAATNYPLFLLGVTLILAMLNACLAPLFAGVQAVCGAPRRAIAVAIVMISLNAVAMTLGPLGVGLLSDGFTRIRGVVGLRYGLMATAAVLPVAAALLLWSERTMPADLEP